jgi:hypothetical protein
MERILYEFVFFGVVVQAVMNIKHRSRYSSDLDFPILPISVKTKIYWDSTIVFWGQGYGDAIPLELKENYCYTIIIQNF